MVRIRNGRVTAIGERRPGATELRVSLDGEDGEVDAISYDQLTGPVAVGDRVVLNTTAVALGLGTGGFHVVMARVGGPVDAPGPGHVIKARYTPSQVRVLAVEEEDSPHRAAVAACTDLGGLPVVCAELHSMVPVVAAAARAVAGDLRVAYVMTDGGALPLAFSRLAAELRPLRAGRRDHHRRAGVRGRPGGHLAVLGPGRGQGGAGRRRGRGRPGAGGDGVGHRPRVLRHPGRRGGQRRRRPRRAAGGLPAAVGAPTGGPGTAGSATTA